MLKTLSQLPSMLYQQAQQTEGCHDNDIIAALFAALVVQEQLGIVFIYGHLMIKTPRKFIYIRNLSNRCINTEGTR